MRRFTLTTALIAFLTGRILLADGFVLPLTGPITDTIKAQLSSDAQRALILWDDGQETLHLKSSYSGPASDFAWVIPVPRLPEVKRSDWSLFKQAEKATRPRLTVTTGYAFGFRGLGIGCSAPASEPEKQTPATTVRVLQSLNIRELHIDIVAAAEFGGFIRWLHQHQYAVPGRAEPILQEYIDADFYFVVVKIGRSSSWAERKGVTQAVSGGLTPLAITFAAEEPFYPLAVSAISAAPENELLLLTAAPLRLEPVEYASDRLTYDDIEETIVPELTENQNAPLASSVDFGPAVKAAQERAPSPSLIMQSAVTMAWRGAKNRMLVGPRSVYAEEGVVITRFHAFLKPREMKDVTFIPAERGLFDGNFFIDLTDPRYRESTQRASATLMMLGLVTAATTKSSRYAKGNLQKLALILLLLGLVLA